MAIRPKSTKQIATETKTDLQKSLEASLPPLVPRHGIKEKYGIPYADGYLANLDSLHLGPGVVKIGGRAVYPKASLIKWLVARMA